MKPSRYRRAVALAYDPAVDDAPRVAAEGAAGDADEIVRIARRYGVPVIERPPLSELLRSVSAGEEIPRALYDVVAKLLDELDRSV